MSAPIFRSLQFWRRKTPLIMQTEAAECGLACIAMVAGHYGYDIDLQTLRREHAITQKGSTLKSIIEIADTMQLAARPLRVEIAALDKVRLPAIVHYDFNHFVVLTELRGDTVTLHDPGRGARTLTLTEFSKHFTGVILELTPTASFKKQRFSESVSVWSFLSGAKGLKAALLRLFIGAIAFEVFAIAMPWLTQLTIDEVLISADRSLMTILAIGFVLIVLVQACIFALRGWLLVHLTTTLSLQVLTQLFSHLLRLPLAFFEKRHVGDLLSRFSSMDAIQRTLTASSVEVMIDGVLALSMLAVMLIYSPKLTLVVLVFAAIYALLRWALYRPLREALNEHLVFTALQQSHFIESLRGVQAIKLYQGEPDRIARWQNAIVDTLNASIRQQTLSLVYKTASFTLFGIESVIVIWFGANEVMNGSFSVGMLLAFIAYKLVFVTRLANLIDKVSEFALLNLHAERVADVALAEREHAGHAPAPDLSRARWDIENLGYRYGPQDAFIFRNVNFTIELGETVALTGPSGVGKTTLAKVVLGLLPATEGRVLINGVDIREIDPASLRGQIGAVMQEDYVFFGSVAENVSLFEPEMDQERIRDALKAAALLDDIERMPMRIDTLVVNAGSVLSGGQRQRLLLARALYRQPKFLMLDEATSALDNAREATVNQVVKELGITTLIIAHRDSTVAMASKRVGLG